MTYQIELVFYELFLFFYYNITTRATQYHYYFVLSTQVRINVVFVMIIEKRFDGDCGD